MVTEVALITVSCVLFIQMGLCEAIEDLLLIKFRVLSCPKCLTMWACLSYFVLHQYSFVPSIATSFIASYLSQWIVLLYDAIALLYNYLYEELTITEDTSEDAERPESPTDIQDDSDEVS